MTKIFMKSGSNEADIQDAINNLKSGGTIVLAQGESVAMFKGLNIDMANRDITLDLNGATLKQMANVGVIRAQGGNDVPRTVSLSEAADGKAVATFSVLPGTVKVGDWLKIVSDDKLPGDRLDDGVTPTRLGQALEVVAVKGNTVTFANKLEYADKYVTNVRAAEISSGDLVVKNGAIIGDQPKAWTQPLVQLRNLIDARVEDMSVSDGSSRAINIGNCINALVKDVVVKNMATSGFMTGTAVHSVSSTGTTVDGLYAEKVGHATDNNSIGTALNSASVAGYGADIGMKVMNSTAFNTTNFAWSWHSEGLNGSFDNVAAVDSFGFMNARGIGGTMTDSIGVNNTRGLLLFEHGQSDARGITLERVTVKDTVSYALHVAGTPQGNTLIDSSITGGHGAPKVAAGVLSLQNSVLGTPTGSINETINGNAGANNIAGGAGVDTINGGAGDDSILGGHGADVMTGGAGRDRFVFHRVEEGGDMITDFTTGTQADFIDLSVMASRLGWSRDVSKLFADGFVSVQQSGVDTHVLVDVNGGGNAYVRLATLQGVSAASITKDQFILRMSDADIGSAVLPANTVVVPAVVPTVVVAPVVTPAVVVAAPVVVVPPVPVVPGPEARKGGAGNDFFMATAATESFDGGAGLDRVDYRQSKTGLVIDMTDPSASTGIAKGDRFISVENVVGTDFADTITGGEAADYLYGGNGDDVIHGGGGNDVLHGELGSDTMIGGAGNDSMRAGDGDDLMIGGSGADTFVGEAGTDTVSYAGASSGVTVSMLNINASALGDDGAGDRFYGVEIIIASRFDDIVVGDAHANRLEGGAGHDRLDGGLGIDVLIGGTGNDTLIGGGGRDELIGGEGSDIFSFGNRATFGDKIADFEAGVDKLAFTRSDLGVATNAAFTLNVGDRAQVTGEGPTFLFDTRTGLLSLDADGIGRAGSAMAVAYLDPTIKLAMSDFLIQ